MLVGILEKNLSNGWFQYVEIVTKKYTNNYFTLTNTTYLDISFICSVSGRDCSLVLDGRSMLLGSTSMRFNT